LSLIALPGGPGAAWHRVDDVTSPFYLGDLLPFRVNT
jgi:hypothetical protein